MWLPLTLLVLAGTVAADFDHGWKSGNEYTYLVRSRTLASLNELSNQFTGILIKAKLTVQAKSSDRLTAKVSNSQYARIHKELPDGWDSPISDQALELRSLPMSEKPFQIQLKHGVIRDVIVDHDVPTWEVNILKSIVSQLQVDSQGENAIKSNKIQAPTDDEPYGSFNSMEDSVGGKCLVLYDMTPLPEEVLHMNPQLAPLPHLKDDGQLIDITKTKNFDKCDQRMNYHFGISGRNDWEPGSNDNGDFLSKSATSRIIISGNLKRFTIQSSVTTNKMNVSPRLFDQQNGLVVSRMNLTLADVNKISNAISPPKNPESAGNLVYTFNDPFPGQAQGRSPRGRNTNKSHQSQSSGSKSSVSSSEESRRGQNQGSMSSSSSSSSSSSISSSEENDFWQPKPNLEDAPPNPLLPHFIGYKGKAIGESNDVDVVKDGKKLINEISSELEDPSSIPGQQTLEKFTILSALIRTMNKQEISELASSVKLSPNELKSNDKSQAAKQNAWSVFRDAVAQAGTGPALLIIKKLIEKKDIGNLEAADILSRLPKNARAPTAEYTKAFFELATSPNVENEPILNTSAIVAFAELLRHSQVNTRSIHNRYPVHTFGRMVSKHDQALKEKYIPHMARKLNKAFQENSSQKIQTYVMALGAIGHPKILSVFEPYLEGREQATDFQRTLMVASLGKLAENFRKLARSVLYKIYLNTNESHEVRCTAVFLLMKTNPPLSMLQRMAEFTNHDANKHVNSAVKSTLTSFAELDSPEHQDLAQKCRTAASLLTEDDFSFQFSHGYISDSVDSDKNIVSQIIANYVGSDDSYIPRAIYLAMFSSFGDFTTPPTELTAMISSVRPVLDMAFGSNNGGHNSGRSAAEKIAEQLNIIPEEASPLEGNLLYKSKFMTRFIPFDKPSLRHLPDLLAKHVLATKDEAYINSNRLMSYDVTLSFPTESGLPFVFTLRVPILYKISGSGQAKLNNGPEISVKSNLRAVYSQKVQGRIGFVTPFEHQYFVAGVDVNFQTYAPVKFAVDASAPDNKLQLKVWPLKGEENAKVLHYSVLPYTSTHDVLSLRPLGADKNTYQVNADEIKKVNLPNGNRAIQIEIEGEKSDRDFWNLDPENLAQQLSSPWTMDDDKYRKVNVYLNLDRNQDEPLKLTAAYDSLDMEPNAKGSQQWSSEAKAIEPSDKKPDSEGRRSQYLSEAAKGIQSAQSQVLDVQLQLPSEPQSQAGITVAFATSNVENKSRAQLFMFADMPSSQVKYEFCAASQARSSPDNLPYFDQALQTQPQGQFDVDIRYGKTCSQGERVNIKGKASQSSKFNQHVENTPLAKACQQQMKHGNKILTDCRNAAAMAMMYDEVEISMDVHSKKMEQFVNKVLGLVGDSDYADTRLDVSNPKNAGKKKIDIKARLSEDLESADFSIHTPAMDLHLDDVDLTPLGITPQDLMPAGDPEADSTNLDNNEYESSCMLDKTRAETFDGREFPLRLGDCWHALMATYPKENPEKPNNYFSIPEESSVSILAKETSNGEKKVKILLGDDEIILKPSHSQSRPEASVNGQSANISPDSSFQRRDDDEVAFEIFQIEDNAVGLSSNKFDVDLAFDGKRITIQAADKYRNSVRGLCGNFDGDLANDFMGPKNCLFRKPEKFIASYALTGGECQGESQQIAMNLQSHDCKRSSGNRFSNVFDDFSGGNHPYSNWGYQKSGQGGNKRCSTHRTQIHEDGDQICFTTRPVFACGPGCSATERKSKNFNFHCMDRNESSLNLKKRIEKGANPDLSQKSVTMSRSINVPLACN